jgi:hypothetical protein
MEFMKILTLYSFFLALHSENLPKIHGDAVNEGVEAPVLGEMCKYDAPDREAGKHAPPRR